LSKYKTTKMFALQVSTHDTMWGGPKEAPSKIKRLIKIVILLPAFALFLMPSFKLGRATYRTPQFKLPDSIKQGNVFTVPADQDITSIQLEGHSLPELKLKQPLFLVAASSVPMLDLVLNYRAPEKKLSLKSLIPHFEHPEYDVFNKQIKIDPPEEQTSPVIAGGQVLVHGVAPVPAIDAKTFTRTDGLVSASCWKEPSLVELPAQPGRNGRRPPPRQAALTVAGQGEVLQVTAPALGADKTVLVYHGGGLYSRYYGIRDSKVRKGDRISAGQQIATTEAGNWRRPASARWDLYLNQTELNRSNFLALSSQICETK
jgi:hypothetical protein